MSAFKIISEFVSKKENLINSVLLYMLTALCAFNLVFWNVSMVDKATIAGGAAVISIMFIVNIKYLKSWQFCLVLLNMLSLTMTLVLNQSKGLGVVLTAFYLTISIVLYNTITFDKRSIIISRAVLCGAVFLLFAMSKYQKTNKGNWIQISDIITNGKINNNSIAILIAALIFLLAVLLKSYYESERKGSLLTVGIITIIGIAFAYTFGGRIAITSIAIFFVLLMLRGVKIKTSLYRHICIILFILALIFPMIYIYLYHSIGNFDFMGKNFFTGREKIWDLAFEQIATHPIFGSGTALNYGNNGDSTHNAVLEIWKSVGVIPLITVIICFFKRRYEYIKLEDRAIIAFLIIMFTESFFMDSHFSFIFLAIMLRSHDQVEADLQKTRFEKWVDQKVLNKRKA